MRSPVSHRATTLVATGSLLAAFSIPLAGQDAAPGNPANTRYIPMPQETITADPAGNARRNAYFGDMHVHTTYSFDAFAFGTLATPYDAYRYARGEPIKHALGFDMQLRQPLDFYAVTDHAMFLGVSKEAADTSTPFSKLGHVDYMHDLNAPENRNAANPNRGRAFSSFLTDNVQAMVNGDIDHDMVYDITRSAWADTVKAANDFYRPGEFTTFVAYEYTTSTPDRGNLHRNVFFRSADRLPTIPFSRFHDQNPEGLWDWLDGLRADGIEALAIPHNSNGSNGHMFALNDWAGNPLDDAYAAKRMRNEPLIELTQIKGTSETHPLLSDSDEWADYEIMPYRIATMLYSEPKGSYARDALLNGLAFEDKGVANPYQFGFIGASDTHTGAIADNEAEFYGKIGLLDSTGQLKGSLPMSDAAARQARDAGVAAIKDVDGKTYRNGAQITWAASGLAGVWAERNTRESIYDALRRKETFATTGPRIKVRLFAGYDFDESMLHDRAGIARAYETGVPQGSELLANGKSAPTLFAWASRDGMSAPLQRLQIVKGWTVDGTHNEKVYDVACSDGLEVGARTHRCPDNGAKVNLTDCSIASGTGAGELKAVWEDPDFDPDHRAFYYLRVLENPTCRWSTWDAVRAGVPPRSDVKLTVQERAWTSAIWFVPES